MAKYKKKLDADIGVRLNTDLRYLAGNGNEMVQCQKCDHRS